VREVPPTDRAHPMSIEYVLAVVHSRLFDVVTP
jgi:hypothetical protein